MTRSDLLGVFDRSDEDIRDHVIADILRTDFCINTSSVKVRVDQGVVTLCGELEKQTLIPMVGEPCGRPEVWSG